MASSDPAPPLDLHLTGTHAPLRLWTVRYTRLRAWSFPRLLGSYWRCYWNDAPGAAVREGEERHPLGPDVAVLIAPEAQARPELTRPGCGHLHFHFSPGLERARREDAIWSLRLSPADRARFKQMVELLRAGDEPAAHFHAHALLNEMLSRLPTDLWARAPADARIRAALEAMDAAFPRGLSNPSLAERAGMHVNAFIRRFTQVIGESPRRHLLTRRIEEAGMLLHHTDLSLEEIAERTGFADRFHFSRVFRARMNVGPATFRRLAAR